MSFEDDIREAAEDRIEDELWERLRAESEAEIERLGLGDGALPERE